MRLEASVCVALYLVLSAACARPPTPARIAPPAPGAPPPELRVPGLTEYRDAPGLPLVADRIYVVGRSDTRIAYLNEPGDEACGCYTPEIVVEDLRAGETVWKDSYDSGEIDPTHPDPAQLQNLDELWRARGADWEQHLGEQGITFGPVTALATIPTGGTAIPRFEVHTEQLDDTSPEGYAHLTSYRIDLVTSSGTKTIDESTGDADGDLLSIDVPGYVATTDHGFAAVLIHENHRGWEGTPTVDRLRFVDVAIDDDVP